ncbi:MAG TPA: hypothetical protein VGM90_09835 [Kofleriaceae bacterium]|jgi:hypothetical protein
MSKRTELYVLPFPDGHALHASYDESGKVLFHIAKPRSITDKDESKPKELKVGYEEASLLVAMVSARATRRSSIKG